MRALPTVRGSNTCVIKSDGLFMKESALLAGFFKRTCIYQLRKATTDLLNTIHKHLTLEKH